MTNFKEKHFKLLSDIQSLYNAAEPLKERYHAFISANPCEDLAIVPWYTVEEAEGYDYLGNPIGKVKLSVKSYALELPELPLWELDYNDFKTHAESKGITYQTERNYIDENVICDDSRFFTIPYEYFHDPEQWEAEVLTRIQTRNEIVAEVARVLYPEISFKTAPEGYYLMDDTVEIDVNGQEVYLEMVFLEVTFGTDQLPQEGEPGYRKLNCKNSFYLNTETGDLDTNDEVLPNAIDMSRWVGKEIG